MEAAVSLSAFVVVLILGIAAVLAVVNQLRVVDAAGEAARLAARGDHDAARAAVERLAPAGAVLTVGEQGEFISATVVAPAIPLLPGVRLTATSVALREGSDDG